MKRWQFQAMFHFLMEDWFKYEHDLDFDDFKATVMKHRSLCDANYYLASMIENAEEDLNSILGSQLTD